MKKTLLIAVVVFLAVFLLWPAYGYSSSGDSHSCAEGSSLSPPSALIDCGPSKDKTEFGGGFRYLLFKAQMKTPDPASSDTSNFFLNQAGDTFRPVRAVLGALLYSILVAGLIVASHQIKTKRHKPKV